MSNDDLEDELQRLDEERRAINARPLGLSASLLVVILGMTAAATVAVGSNYVGERASQIVMIWVACGLGLGTLMATGAQALASTADNRRRAQDRASVDLRRRDAYRRAADEAQGQ